MNDEPDSLRRAVEARDRRYNDARRLRLMARGPARAKRVCRACWTLHNVTPIVQPTTCPACGGVLDDVSI